jgi:hypothetical protein
VSEKLMRSNDENKIDLIKGFFCVWGEDWALNMIWG